MDVQHGWSSSVQISAQISYSWRCFSWYPIKVYSPCPLFLSLFFLLDLAHYLWFIFMHLLLCSVCCPSRAGAWDRVSAKCAVPLNLHSLSYKYIFVCNLVLMHRHCGLSAESPFDMFLNNLKTKKQEALRNHRDSISQIKKSWKKKKKE